MNSLFRYLSALALVLASLSPFSVWAAPGALDTTFGGGDGWTSTGFQSKPTDDAGRSVIRQADGKLVVAGRGSNGSNNDFALVRYNSDGSLDATFDGDGKLITDIGASWDEANSVIQQADGKLVAAGFRYNGSNFDFALVRYNSDGTLDTTFNGTGKLTTAIGIGADQVYSVIQQADGKLVAAGYSHNGSNYDFALVRYNSDGSLDTTFDGDGKLTTAIGIGADQVYSVIQQADGKLVAAGYSHNGSNNEFALARYNSDGSLDNTFDGDGKLTTAIGVPSDEAYSVIQQADGKLVVAGTSWNGSNYDFALVRYNSDGTLDSTFNGTGKLTTAIGTSSDSARSVIQQADGKLVAAGYSYNGSNNDFALVRYNSDGSLDATFDGDGKLTAVIGASTDQAASVIQQADGKLVAAGYSYKGSNNDFALVRYNSDGSLDATFDGDGKLTTDIGASVDYAQSVIQQADGKLVVAGTSWNGSNNDFALVRYNSDGSLDVTFDGDGKLTTAIGASDDGANSVIQQADGKLVAAGHSNNGSNWDFALARYNSDGTLDATFDGDGKLTTAIGASTDSAWSVIQQADGKLVAAGNSHNGSNEDFALVRYNSDGSLDTSFNGTGKMTTAIGTSTDSARSVIQQADGKLVAAGISRNDDNEDFALVRYNSDGSLDTSFNGTGKLTTAIGASTDEAWSVIQQADGKLVAAGYSHNGINNSIALVRYNSDGSLDATFDGDGKLTTAIGTSADYAYSVIQQADGKLVAAGRSHNGSNFDFALVRYNSDGTMDVTFDGDGKLTMAIGTDDRTYSVIQQADGKLVAAGYSSAMPTGQEFVVARLESGQTDTDSDGLVDGLDPDNDNDGVGNTSDAFPLDPTESVDTDRDGIGNNADPDDDGDGTPDHIDAEPLNPAIGENVLLLNGSYSGSRIRESANVQ